MKKNDKIIVVLGVLILILASVGIYYYEPLDLEVMSAEISDFEDVNGVFKNIPESITVSDDDPFYSLIATPVAVHYDTNGEQEAIPLYVEKLDDPSTAVTKVKCQLGVLGTDEYITDGAKSAKEVSLETAQNFWESSKAALLIEDSEPGYCLGVIATPIASYLSIPVIVTDKVDSEVTEVLTDLGVENTIVCGENLEGYGNVLEFNTVEKIVDASIDLLMEKFGDINYITLTNPVDACPPKVLDSVEFSFGPDTIKSSSQCQLIKTTLNVKRGSNVKFWYFTIPEDYKYALIKFEGINHETDQIDLLGDSATFSVGVNNPDLPRGLQSLEAVGGGTAWGGAVDRDESGKIVTDHIYTETVVYGRGGEEYKIKAIGTWLTKPEGQVSANVVVEKLENPVYPMMKGLSAVAPYLTAYHKGIVFGKPEFNFTADDDVTNDKGETYPGFYVPRRNSELVPISNRHIYDNIHVPLNNLLAKLANISLEKEEGLKCLREYYKENPVYIALVGGTTGLPNYIYQNELEPVGDYDGDGTDDTPYYTGGGTPSDVIYGDIDPIPYDWSNLAGDVYSEYPFQENIVGRITGWDVQDASALIARSIFYDDIVDQMGEWKDNFGLLMGGGQDFQKPAIRYRLFSSNMKRGEPMKLDTGYSEMLFERTSDQIVDPLGFTLNGAMFEEAMKEGLSDEAIKQIKKANTFNLLFFRIPQVKRLAGEDVVKGGDVMESSNFIFANGHGCNRCYGMGGNDLTAAGFGGPIMHWLLKQTIVPLLGGMQGPGGDLGKVGDYDTRSISEMDFGPSVMWLESCTCGRIDGLYAPGNVGQAHMHAGLASLIASSTGSNIAGGYLEPKNRMYDSPLGTALKYIKAKTEWKKGIFDDPHFGYRIYTDLCKDLEENDVSIGLAFRNARNSYLPADADYSVWWTPPLGSSSDAGGEFWESKYTSFQEYMLFGDPALNPYEPVNEG